MFVLLGPAGAAFGQNKVVVPDKFAGTVVLGSKKNYTYYALSDRSDAKLTVRGPGELTVYTRVRVGTDESASESFDLKYVIDGSKVKTKTIGPLKPSSRTKFVSKLEGVPTVAAKTTIQIPPGKHVIQFYKSKTKQPIHSRFLFSLFNKPIWKDYKPATQLEKVELKYSSGKASPNYYRISSKDEFVFQVKDSARVRIFVRDEFTYKMLSENNLRLEVTETGKDAKVYKFLTKRAKNLTYSAMSKYVPSYLKSLYLDLPASEQPREYRIKLKSGGGSALIRVSYDSNLIPNK